MNTNAGKISFSVHSKSSSKSNLKRSQNISQDKDEDHHKKEFVTEFDPNKTLTDTKSKPRLIIPPKPDECCPHKKMKNLDVAISQSNNNSDQLQWELEKKTDADDDSNKISYGLNLRNSSSNQDVAAAGSRSTVEPVDRVQLKDFKSDLDRLPDDEGFEQFEDMPVEEFGAALLGGLGWYQGRGIGKNAKGNVEIKEFGKKSFVSDDANISVKINKPKEERDRDGFSVGRNVRVIGGKHVGSKGRIVERVGDDFVVASLENSQKEVKLGVYDITYLGSKEEEMCLKKFRESRISEKSGKDKQVKYQGSQKQVDKGSRENVKRDNNNDKDRIYWLRSHIRVRIISKEFRRGRLYLKKGAVVDVVGPTTCDISIDDSGELIQGVEQDLLETALPKRGGPVLVLYGRHKGVYGSLVDRDLDRETGVVRDADTHELLNVKLEQIAEYVGDPSDIGY